MKAIRAKISKQNYIKGKVLYAIKELCEKSGNILLLRIWNKIPISFKIKNKIKQIKLEYLYFKCYFELRGWK